MDGTLDQKEKEIRELWRTPGFAGAFTGLATFRSSLALDKNIHVSKKKLFNIMQHDEDFVLETKRKRKHFQRRKFLVHGFSSVWQADLAEMPVVNSFVGFLCCIDVFSRNIYCALLKSKEATVVRAAFRHLFKEAKSKPEKLETDRGSEFQGNKSFFKSQQIFYKIKVGKNKAAFAEHAIQVRKKINQKKLLSLKLFLSDSFLDG